MAKKKLKFVKDMFYNDPVKPIFEAGKVYEVDEAKGWADRWIIRGAIIVGEEPVAVETEKTEDIPVVQTASTVPLADSEEAMDDHDVEL